MGIITIKVYTCDLLGSNLKSFRKMPFMAIIFIGKLPSFKNWQADVMSTLFGYVEYTLLSQVQHSLFLGSAFSSESESSYKNFTTLSLMPLS